MPEQSTYIQEKSSDSKYVFKVHKGASKGSVSRAIAEIYGVIVTSVNILNSKGKSRTFKRIKGRVSGFKKAVVTLEKGSKIDIMQGGN